MGLSDFFRFGMSGKERLDIYHAVFTEDDDFLYKIANRYGTDARFQIAVAEGKLYNYIMAPLFYDLNEIKNFINEYGVEYINAKNKSGETVLYNTVKFNFSDNTILKFLIKEGADPNVSNNLGETPLMLAVSTGNYEALEILLKAGASLDKRNKRGGSFFDYRSSNQKIRTLLHTYKEIRKQEKSTFVAKKAVKDFWVININDNISKYIQAGDIKSLRSVFDNLFYSKEKIKLNSNHLKSALLRKDKPILRLLISYGAVFSDTEIEIMKKSNIESFNKNITMLRECGLNIARPAKRLKNNIKINNPKL